MTGGSAHDAGAGSIGHNSQGDGDTGRRRQHRRQFDGVPDSGKIRTSRSSIADTIMAVSFLVLVTLVAFLAVSVIGELSAGNRLTYWMIELIFALLCGGAGALVGGSAVVRSTLRIPGSPVHATLGGAISMVIVGFALAYLGQPASDEMPMYAVDIQHIPQSVKVDGVDYSVYVGAVNSNLSFSRDPNKVSIKIPAQIDRHKLLIAVYRLVDKDLSRTYARCELIFETIDSPHTSVTPMELVPGTTAPQFHLYFSDSYAEKAITIALQRKDAVTTEPCVEGQVATKADLTPLDGHFTLQPNSAGTRALSLARLTPLPRYSVLARDRSNNEPSDTLPDLPPRARLAPGPSASMSLSPASEPQVLSHAAQTATVVVEASPPLATAPAVRAHIDMPTAPTAPPAADTAGAPAAAPPPADAKSSLREQVDAYVRGEDRDRTALYQSWGDVAEYVVSGLRAESAKDSKLVATYLNLIANALNVIDEGRYLAPTLRPNWDESVKPDRLLKSQDIPAFVPNDYKIVVASLCSTDEDVRRAAQRLLKLYPSNKYHADLKALPNQPNFEKCQKSFITESAAYYFYNRIVEFDGTFALDQPSTAWIDDNYSEGAEWAKQGEAQDSTLGNFTAMLKYARGLVLWDHGQNTQASASFNGMIDSLHGSTRSYPSNPQHIATAVKLIHDPARSSKPLRGAAAFTALDRHPVSKGYILGEGGVTLYAVPDLSAKQIGKMKPDVTARIYLRLANWDLLEGGGHIGWARRAVASAAK